jgi:hypothetical protein
MAGLPSKTVILASAFLIQAESRWATSGEKKTPQYIEGVY